MNMEILAESAVRVTVLALGVALLLRILQIRSPRVAHGAWTVVIVVMLVLPAVVAWGPEFAVPLLPSHSASARLSADIAERGGALRENAASAALRATPASERRISWALVALAAYAAGVALLLLRLAIGLRHARAIRRAAVVGSGRLTHPACITPMTVGLLAPAVILPVDWARWDDAELAAVLAHEEEHVRRRDPLVAAVALVNRAIFWFHPLAWWLPREVARLSEQACDAVVIARGHDSDVYSACLLRFARRASSAGRRLAPTAMAMPGAGLRDRLGKLTQPPTVRPSRSRLLCGAIACTALVVVSAAAVPTAAPAQSGQVPGRAQPSWRVDTSEHFEIAHASLPPDRVRDAIRDAEAAYEHVSAALKYDMPRRVSIVLVSRDGEIDVATTTGSGIPTADGTTSAQRIVLSLESLDRRDGLVVHELTHQFAFDIIPATSRLSPFLIEGLAEHQRGTWNAQELRTIRNDVAARAIPSVASLGPTDRHWAHAVFDFVAAQDGAEGVRRLLFALRAKETLTQAVSMAFDVTPDQFDRTFRGYVTTRFGL